MLQLAENGPFWSGPMVELNLSFATLRDYQWVRLLKALWDYPSIGGPLESRYQPGAEQPATVEMMTPDPTAAFSQFGLWEVSPEVRAGIEVLVTRSLFECVSVLIPVNMFANVTTAPDDSGLLTLEKLLYDLAVHLYTTTVFDIAAIGIDRGCQLLGEFVTDIKARNEFVRMGNFLARDDILATLRLEPRAHKEVMPMLRWFPPNR